MVATLNAAEFAALLEAGDVSPDELRRYFEIDPEESRPFAPAFRLKDGVLLPSEGGAVIAGGLGLRALNWITRGNRQRDYRDVEADRSGDRTLISDGDSWFLHPLLRDVVNHLFNDHLVYSLDGAGDTLERMVEKGEVLRRLEHHPAQGVLLSGGGNDLLGDSGIEDVLLKPRGTPSATRYVNKSALKRRVEGIVELVDDYVARLLEADRALKIFVHGYDYAQPVPGGRWLGGPMEGLVPRRVKPKWLRS